MEAGQYGLTLVTCFLACRLELDAVAGLLWISRYVLGGGADVSVFFLRFFFFECARPAASMRPPLASFYLSTSNEAREAFFSWFSTEKSLFITGHARRVGRIFYFLCECVYNSTS